LRIADAIRSAIEGGQLQRGESLPSTRALGRTLRVHRHTVMTALGELVAEGWLTAQERQTYRVNDTLPSWFFEPDASPPAPASTARHEWRLAREVRSVAADPAGVRYAFRSGLADLRLFPQAELKSHFGDALRHSRTDHLGYADPGGHPPLVGQLRTYLRRVRAISGRDILVTNGSQEAIFLTAQLLIRPGDWVAVERLGYGPAWDALRAAGARLCPIRIDGEGLDLEDLERQLRRRRIRLIYTTPLHQYPTTTTLPLCRRLRLYEVAARADVPILEDDYDHEFHYRSQPLPPLASRDPAERVIYVSTLSKILFPSARIGFMAVPHAIAPRLAAFRRIVSRQNETLLQDAVARWIAAGSFERHLRRMRRIYEDRRGAIVSALQAGRDSGLPWTWQEPDGGMAIWLDTGEDAGAIARKALARNVLVHPESIYTLSGESGGSHLRLGFANQTEDEIRRGIELLARACRD
jgi:GntR family transcriptional regulator/MocR family aminotransferase